MRDPSLRSMIMVAIAAAAVGAIVATSITPSSGQAPAAAARAARVGGKPNLSGIWQANNEANWNLQAQDRKSTRLNSSHLPTSRMPSSA